MLRRARRRASPPCASGRTDYDDWYSPPTSLFCEPRGLLQRPGRISRRAVDSPATENISIGQNFSALSCFRIETFTSYENRTYNPKLIIGNNVSFNNDCHIGCINRIEIGNNVLGASRIYITDHYHGNITSDDLQYLPGKRPLSSKGPVIIEDNVWIGEGVAILPGVTIGVNSIIGANSVVNKDIPANCVAAGIPARVVKHLN